MRGEVRHASLRGSGWTDETDEPGRGPGPLLEPKPPGASRASAGEQSARHQQRHALPHRRRHRQQVRTTAACTYFPPAVTQILYLQTFVFPIRRKLSGKSKKWRSIFNLGRSVDAKGKLNRNGSVFIRTPGITGEVSRQEEWVQFASGQELLFDDRFIDKVHILKDLFFFVNFLLQKRQLFVRPGAWSRCVLYQQVWRK